MFHWINEIPHSSSVLDEKIILEVNVIYTDFAMDTCNIKTKIEL